MINWTFVDCHFSCVRLSECVCGHVSICACALAPSTRVSTLCGGPHDDHVKCDAGLLITTPQVTWSYLCSCCRIHGRTINLKWEIWFECECVPHNLSSKKKFHFILHTSWSGKVRMAMMVVLSIIEYHNPNPSLYIHENNPVHFHSCLQS